MTKSIVDFLLAHSEKKPISFHMPGHKGSEIYKKFGYEEFLDRFMDCDITEIPGADNLFQMEGIIKQTSEKYAKAYGVKKSYLLVNGTSGGIIASILASVSKGGKLIMARNCHKSVFNALTFGSISPVYAYPSVIEEYGISGQITVEEVRRCLSENPKAEAVILPSPNYYGICSDIKAIADEVHSLGKILIVDQAHGAHLKFMKNQPPSAEDSGADIVINSTHKTLASFTQSAVLNVNSQRISQQILEDKLQAVQSTSPSYIMMASLDINADILLKHGDELFRNWQENLTWFYENVKKIKGIRVMNDSQHMDSTKINLDMSNYGIDGSQLEEILMQNAIFSELVTGDILMCMTGIGNSASDYEKLFETLSHIAEKNHQNYNTAGGQAQRKSTGAALWNKRRTLCSIPEIKETVHIDESEGEICASSIIPYPPGIPFICPGERIGRNEIEYIKELRMRGEKVIGVDENMHVVVGREKTR